MLSNLNQAKVDRVCREIFEVNQKSLGLQCTICGAGIIG